MDISFNDIKALEPALDDEDRQLHKGLEYCKLNDIPIIFDRNGDHWCGIDGLRYKVIQTGRATGESFPMFISGISHRPPPEDE